MSKEKVLNAIYFKNLEALKQGLKECNDYAFLNEPDEFDVYPIFDCIKKDRKGNMLSLLLEVGIDPYVVDKEQRNAIYYAELKQNQVAKKLLRFDDHEKLVKMVKNNIIGQVKEWIEKKGLSVHTRDDRGNTLLMLACQNGKDEMIHYLIEKGANPTHQNRFGENVLDMIFGRPNAVEIADLLVFHGVIPTDKMTRDCQSLALSAAYHSLDALKWCRRRDIEFREPKNHGFTTLTVAAQEGNLEMVKFLINEKLDINHQDEFGKTPLHWAAERHVDIVEYLLAAGADVTIQNQYGQKPIDIAKREERKDIIKLLKEKG